MGDCILNWAQNSSSVVQVGASRELPQNGADKSPPQNGPAQVAQNITSSPPKNDDEKAQIESDLAALKMAVDNCKEVKTGA